MELKEQDARVVWDSDAIEIKFPHETRVAVFRKESKVVWANEDNPKIKRNSEFVDYMRWWKQEHGNVLDIPVKIVAGHVQHSRSKTFLYFTILDIILPLPTKKV